MCFCLMLIILDLLVMVVFFSLGMTELPLLDYSLKEMFMLLSLDNILAIFRSVLLEHQVLLFSRGSVQLFVLT